MLTRSALAIIALSAAMASSERVGAAESWHHAPVILRVSDCVRPGELFQVYGEGLTASLRLYVAAATDSGHPIAVAPVFVDPRGHFATAELARGSAGVKTIWAANQWGASNRIRMNAPRRIWLAHRDGWPGQRMSLVGFNLLASQFGSAAATLVRLIRASAVMAKIIRVDRYAVSFEVPAVAPGGYMLEVSNDGGQSWTRASDSLIVRAKADDPVGLGVAWVADFAWSRRVDIGARAAGETDDNGRIQRALDAAARGGGIVRLPAGNLTVRSLRIGSGVILVGAPSQQTTLTYLGGGETMLAPTRQAALAGGFGIAGLKLRVAPGTLPPDLFIQLGQPWNEAIDDVRLRQAKRVFCVDVDIDYSLTTVNTPGHRGLSIIAIGDEECIIARCHFVGAWAEPHRVLFNRYVECSDNYFEYSNGQFVTTASRSFVVRNRLVGHRELTANPDPNQNDLHGIFARDGLYAAYNVVSGMGRRQGEAICVEFPGGALAAGTVASGAADGLQVAADLPAWDIGKRAYSSWNVAIVAGQGLGQMRRIVAVSGRTITIDHAWDVIPDKGSRFTIILPNEDVIIYKNEAQDCTKGFWLYGNAFDAVVDDNVSDRSEGVFVDAHRDGRAVFGVAYFVRLADNTVRGVSPLSRHAGVGLRTDRAGNVDAFGVHAFGVEIRNNRIEGARISPAYMTESPPIDGIFSVSHPHEKGTEPGCDRVAVLVVNNKLSNMDTGITIGRDECGDVVRGNAFVNVEKPMDASPAARVLRMEE